MSGKILDLLILISSIILQCRGTMQIFVLILNFLKRLLDDVRAMVHFIIL